MKLTQEIIDSRGNVTLALTKNMRLYFTGTLTDLLSKNRKLYRIGRKEGEQGV